MTAAIMFILYCVSIVLLAASSIVYFTEDDAEIKESSKKILVPSFIMWAALGIWQGLFITTDKAQENKTVQIFTIDGVQYFKVNGELHNANAYFERMFTEDTIDIYRVDPNKMYFGIYPNQKKWNLK